MPARDTVPQYAIFGKLPTEPDFIRMGTSSHPVVLEFDGLLARSLAHATRQSDLDKNRYLQAGASDFQFTSHDRRWSFSGVLLPNHDKAERLYPLVGGIILPAHAVQPVAAELAIANELFFAGLRSRLFAAADVTDLSATCQRFLIDQCAPDSNTQDELDLAKQMLSRHLAYTTTLDLKDRLADFGFPALDDILMTLIYQADQMRRLGTSAPRQTVAVPLSAEVGESTLDQAAWLALCRAAAGKNRSPDFIINVNRRQLTLAPNRFSDRCLGAFWGVPADPAPAEPPWHRQGVWVEIAWTLGRQLQDPCFALDNLLSTLERITGSHK
jgi:type VI secretion system protein ImpM